MRLGERGCAREFVLGRARGLCGAVIRARLSSLVHPWVLVLCGLLAGACEREGPDSGARASGSGGSGGELRIVATIPPLAGLASAIAPEGTRVESLIEPGVSPHGAEFSAGQLASAGAADVFVYVGLGLESGVHRLTAASRGRQLCFAEIAGLGGAGEHNDHAREGDGPHTPDEDAHDDHTHGVDPHLWLDPGLVATFVPRLGEEIRSAMRARGMDEAGIGQTRARQAALLERVARVDAEYREAFRAREGAAVVVHHNAWSRPAERYGFRVAAVLLPHESLEPSPADLDGAVRAAKESRVRGVLTEPQLSRAVAERVAGAAGVEVVMIDPLGSGDWEGMMRENLAALLRAASEPGDE